MNIRMTEFSKNIKKNILEKQTEIKKLGSALLIYGTIAITSITSTASQAANEDIKIENQEGHDNINPRLNNFLNFFKQGVDEDEFIIVNVGDSKKIGVLNQKEKLEYCNSKDISLGIIITPTSILANDIYDNVELVKGLIRDYKIDFPVYLNIDNIVENYDIDNDMKKRTIKIFLDILSSLGVYVGIYGKDTNLEYLYNYCEIKDEYTVYLVMEEKNNGEIKYSGNYDICIDLDGNIYSKKDFSKIIKEKGKNNHQNITKKGIGKYKIKKEEELLQIAGMFNISVNALLEYNDMSLKEVKDQLEENGKVDLMIPSIIGNIKTSTEPISEVSYSTLEKPVIGIDISHYNKVDWDKVEENFDFMILKCTQGITGVDPSFEENATKCILNNIPFGVYCFNGCRGIEYNDIETFKTDLTKQVENCLRQTANKSIDYPVYLDLETNEGEDVKDIYTKEQINVMLDNWKQNISTFGYLPGLYCNKSTYQYVSSIYDLSDFELWIANYEYTQKTPLEDIKIPTSQTVTYKGTEITADMYQISEKGTNTGAPDGYGNTDIDYSYIDYTKINYTIKDSSDNNDKNNIEYIYYIKEIDRKDLSKVIVPIGCIAVIPLGLGTVLIVIKKQIKRKLRQRVK